MYIINNVYERDIKENWSVAENYCSSFWSSIGKSAQVEKLVSAGNRTRVYGMERHRLNHSATETL